MVKTYFLHFSFKKFYIFSSIKMLEMNKLTLLRIFAVFRHDLLLQRLSKNIRLNLSLNFH